MKIVESRRKGVHPGKKQKSAGCLKTSWCQNQCEVLQQERGWACCVETGVCGCSSSIMQQFMPTRRSIGRIRMLCVPGNYSDHNSRSSSINDSVLAETVYLSETILFEVMTQCSFTDRYQRFD